jgi:hypothetical protein
MAVNPPVVVDLDGTFFVRDIFWSEFLALMTLDPRNFFKILRHLFLGQKALAKHYLAEVRVLNLENYETNESLYKELLSYKKSGHEIFLCSGATQLHVDTVLDNYPIFSQGFGSDNRVNLTGQSKADFLVKSFGEKEFIYIGNSNEDRKIYSHALFSKHVSAYWDNRPQHNLRFQKAKTLLTSMRIKHWVKNLLLFLPILTAHEVFDTTKLFPLIIYFGAFGLVASGSYFINDLIDLQSDSKHATKKNRPIASGAIATQEALAISVSLVSVGLIISALISVELF